MKFVCEKNELVKEIATAQEIISSRNSLSILSNVYLEVINDKLVIKATDLKVGFETSIHVDSVTPGKTTIFCDKFLGILRALPEGEIEFELDDNMMLYIRPRFKKIEFQLKTIPSEKYPKFQEVSKEFFFEFPQSDFLDMISKTIFSVSNDETRYFMNGPFLEKIGDSINMVATDGRRLSLISKKINVGLDDIKGIIIPVKILSLVKKLASGEGNLKIAISDKTIFFDLGNVQLSSSLIEGQFPNYKRVIPEESKYIITVKKDALEDALKRVSVLAEQKSRKVIFSLKANILTVDSEDTDIGEAKEELECSYDGPDVVLAVNYVYVLEPLREMDSETLSIGFIEENKALTIKPLPEKDYMHIVMPMQVN
ncbi:MAG: DNA polymerase III subunit beta [Spirochaetales bacterium]|nr:DNA polymerase III subunit beta [Spirochaetales bacterium]